MSLWGAQWRSENRLDGKREHLINTVDCLPALFRTRAETRAFIEKRYAYIAKRPDLRAEPHGWKMPRAVKVFVVLEPAA